MSQSSASSRSAAPASAGRPACSPSRALVVTTALAASPVAAQPPVRRSRAEPGADCPLRHSRRAARRGAAGVRGHDRALGRRPAAGRHRGHDAVARRLRHVQHQRGARRACSTARRWRARCRPTAASSSTCRACASRSRSPAGCRGSSRRSTRRPLSATPQTIQVIPQGVMAEQGVVHALGRACATCPGITLQAGEGGGASGTAGDMFNMRGFSAANSLFVDNVRDDGLITRDVFNLEQVEVYLGPTGSDVGRGNAAGYVNMATKTARLGDSYGGDARVTASAARTSASPPTSTSRCRSASRAAGWPALGGAAERAVAGRRRPRPRLRRERAPVDRADASRSASARRRG